MSNSASTQYDNIGLAYEDMKKLPAALLERENVHVAVKPYIANASVLDVASGTGYYSRLLRDWGAEKVVGVDISSAMVSAAQDSSVAQDLRPEKMNFHVGDATKPLPEEVTSQGPFDIVLGAWLLNYAESSDTMMTMFRNISSALKPGGVFVAIAPPPALDLDDFSKQYGTAETKAQMKHFGVSVEYLSPTENGEGYNTRVTGHTQPVEVNFENFHLRRDLYERAASEGSMGGNVDWRAVQLPSEEQSREFGVDSKYWKGYEQRPHFGIMVVKK